ncbi:MAG: 50S ribosomal protein L24 [Epulopiscium sp. Nele67-Bin001]|nr:MAG: 50S ribosomal protein L24 [Epulopiscium sp. Nuni2H_MBin001]OON90618.1 MAG: 50S ribosomal protein L24 [Epulopiscium sp. Nele67-Bin001]
MKTKLKKGDRVVVIAGKDKGKEGNITYVDRKNNRVVVSSVNMVWKHQKPNATGQGGRIEREHPIHISNVMYLHKGKPVRLGTEIKGDKKVRIAIVKGERVTID